MEDTALRTTNMFFSPPIILAGNLYILHSLKMIKIHYMLLVYWIESIAASTRHNNKRTRWQPGPPYIIIWSYPGFYSETWSSCGGLYFANNIDIDWTFLHSSWSNTSTHRGNRNFTTWHILPTKLLGMGTRTTVHHFEWSVTSLLCAASAYYIVIMSDVNNAIKYTNSEAIENRR